MNTLTLHDLCTGSFLRMLGNLDFILAKGQAFATEKGIAESQLLQTRLIADMAALPFQVQRVSDIAKLSCSRVGAVADAPVFEDDEQTFEALRQRIQKTVAFIEALPRDTFDGREDEGILNPSMSVPMPPVQYLLDFAFPNAYFHVTTAYDLLRHQGVPLGKRDYLGRTLPWKNP